MVPSRHAVRVSPQFSSRLIDSARSVLNRYIPDIYLHSDVYKGPDSGNSPGYALSLLAESTTGVLHCSEAVSIPRVTPFQSTANNARVHPDRLRRDNNIFGPSVEETRGPEVTTPEDVGIKAARELLVEVQRGGCVDRKHQWLVLLFMALGSEDVGRVRMGELSTRT
jgi:RNA 3'-terminal phosphate cyclase-like protein